MPALTEYELERLERIAQNQARLQALGIVDAANQLALATPQASQRRPRKRKQHHVPKEEPRRSGRLQGSAPTSLDEDELFRNIGIDRLDLLATTRRRRVRHQQAGGEKAAEEGPERQLFDSGLGMRIQGGRVYDSTYGVTCHWCRQKTIENHVECTAAGCREGRKLPVSFCRMCLRNRHGEDLDEAVASQRWVCPPCRGSCGEGCTTCCNCGPCRKRVGLGPTHQLIKEARAAGLSNVHDFLVHRATGESPAAIAARKAAAAWGGWLTAAPSQQAEAAAAPPGAEPSAGSPAVPAAAVDLSPKSSAEPATSEATVTVGREAGEEARSDDMEPGDAGESLSVFAAARVVRAQRDVLHDDAKVARKQDAVPRRGSGLASRV